MKIDLNEAVRCLVENDNIVILPHDHPDGDTLGSAFALKRALNKIGKKVKIVCDDVIPEKYSYMTDGEENDDFSDEKFVVAVDVADISLLGEKTREKYKNKINLAIDHHASNRLVCDKLLLEEKAAACCETIYEIIKKAGIEVDKKTADCLYTGLSTDSGCFRYSNTTSRTLRMASELVDLGASHSDINVIMFETTTRTYMRLENLVMKTMQMYYDDRCAIVNISQDMYEKSGSNETETDPIVAKTRQIEGVLVGAVLREKSDGSFKVSLRTNKDLDASAICGLLGGGGHAKAAGCQIDGPLENAREKLLDAIGKYLK